MKYRTFFIDLDDTLLDFKASELLSFYKTFEGVLAQNEIAQLHVTYKEINENLWKLVEKNVITKDFLKVERFKLTFQNRDMPLDEHIFAQKYLDLLPENVVLIEGALDVCEKLKKHGEIVIITNGIETTQKKRIENSPLKNFIDYLSVSEECGAAKPSPIFFDYTAKKLKYFKKNETIMIGDKLETDILGAHKFGIDSFWFNPENNLIKNEIQPTYSTNKLNNIYPMLNS